MSVSQPSLLDYTPPPEQMIPLPSVNIGVLKLAIGNLVQVVQVKTLPQSLVGQVGVVVRMLASNLAEINIDGATWGVETAQIKRVQATVPAPQPRFEISIGDRVLISGSNIWWRVSERFDESWIIDRVVREPLPHTQVQQLIKSADVCDRRTKTGLIRWLEAGQQHRSRLHKWMSALVVAYERQEQKPLHLEALKRERDRLLRESIDFSKQIYEAWEELCQ